MTTDDADRERPVLRVVAGDPTAEELAALLAVVSALSGEPAGADEPTALRSAWASYWRAVRRPLDRGPAGWRNSARPR